MPVMYVRHKTGSHLQVHDDLPDKLRKGGFQSGSPPSNGDTSTEKLGKENLKPPNVVHIRKQRQPHAVEAVSIKSSPIKPPAKSQDMPKCAPRKGYSNWRQGQASSAQMNTASHPHDLNVPSLRPLQTISGLTDNTPAILVNHLGLWHQQIISRGRFAPRHRAGPG